MEESNNKLKTESILSSLSKPDVTENEIQNSQKRVWNSLTTEKLNSIPINQSQIPTSIDDKNEGNWKYLFSPIYQSRYILPVLFFLIILSSIGGYYIYNYNNSKTPVPVSSEVKSKLQTFLKSTPNFENSSSNLASGTDTSKPGSDVAPNTQTQELDPNTALVYRIRYFGREFNPQKVSSLSDSSIPPDTSFDETKFYDEFALDSLQYQKFYTYSNSTVFAEQISTPNYLLMFQGGKYAAKINFTSAIPSTATGFTPTYRPENQVLQSIIDNENIKDLGMQSYKGKEYHVFQLTVNTSETLKKEPTATNATSTNTNGNTYIAAKYYLNNADLSLFREEDFDSNGNLNDAREYSVEKLAIVDAITKYINSDELGKLEIREYSDDPAFYIGETAKLTTIVNKYNVLYADDGNPISSFNDFDKTRNTPIYKLFKDKDFDPNLVLDNSTTDPKYLLTYSQGNYSFEIYNSSNDFTIQNDSGTSINSNIILKINSDKVTAKKTVTNYSSPETDLQETPSSSTNSTSPQDTTGSGSKGSSGSGLTKYEITTVEFSYKNKYYVITDFTQTDFSSLQFKILDSAKSDEFDKLNTKSVAS